MGIRMEKNYYIKTLKIKGIKIVNDNNIDVKRKNRVEKELQIIQKCKSKDKKNFKKC